ncbi:conserved hypothetical protein [Azospirillaceae bacterium]
MVGIEIKENILKFEKRLTKSETYKINKGKGFFSISIFKKPKEVSGVASYCEDGKHCIFLDYDNIAKWLVLEDYKRIQEQFNLPPGYLFTTKNKIEDGEEIGNYHLICLKKFYSNEIFKIISMTHADVNYASMPLRNKYKNWILRISNKGKRDRPKFLFIIGEKINLNCEVSMPHLKFLKEAYNLPDLGYSNIDKCRKIFIQKYETINF